MELCRCFFSSDKNGPVSQSVCRLSSVVDQSGSLTCVTQALGPRAYTGRSTISELTSFTPFSSFETGKVRGVQGTCKAPRGLTRSVTARSSFTMLSSWPRAIPSRYCLPPSYSVTLDALFCFVGVFLICCKSAMGCRWYSNKRSSIMMSADTLGRIYELEARVNYWKVMSCQLTESRDRIVTFL